jgi:tetratricopeptide (TPR) repeat protein
MNNLGFGTAAESPWRAGANENTIFKTTHDLTIGGKNLPAGKYGLHMIVNEDNTATVIFSKNHGAWGSYFYDSAEDALRVDVETQEVSHVEQLTFGFDQVDANSAVASLSWEKKKIPFKVETDVTQNILAEIRQQLQTSPGFNRQSWEQAANFALNNGGDLDEALSWANAAIEGQFFSEKNFNNLSIKSQILERQGKTAEAKAVMDEAMPLGTVFEIHGYGRQLIAQGKKDEALEVFKWNAKNHKGTWPVDYGLARGYSAVGDYKNALKHLKVAEGRAPDQGNKDAIAANITRLQEGTDIN